MRGDNGVMLEEFLGIGDLEELTYDLDEGVRDPIAMYPMASIRNDSKVHDEYSTMMIG